jgi:hypothetical protein
VRDGWSRSTPAPRAGSVVAIVQTLEGMSSFSCRPRKHPTATGAPETGRRPTATAEHHLTRGRHLPRPLPLDAAAAGVAGVVPLPYLSLPW